MYLDCIDDPGNCFIIYWAKADFGLIKFEYSGLIFSNAEGLVIERSTLRKVKKPVINKATEFNNKYLKASLSMEGTDEGIISTLFSDHKNNELIWNCHHPKALADIRYNDRIYKGFGYAETLFSSIEPWNLPIDELRWGRYLSGSDTVIWIMCKGKDSINKLFHNGIEYNDAIKENDTIVFDGGMCQLKFSEIQHLRKGKLSELFSKMPFLRIFLNKHILKTLEIKYKARTAFYKNSLLLSNGWSLYEIVTWEK